MTDPIQDEADAAARASAARTRYFVISLFRLSGIFVLLFGVLIMLKHFDWVQGDRAKWMGFIFACVGFVQTIIVPRMLLRAWATPRDPK